MGLAGEQDGESALKLHYDDGAWTRNAAGEVHWPVLGVLLDVALGAVTRLKTGPMHRPATVQLAAAFTGAPIDETPVARAQFCGYSERTAAKHALAAGTVTSGDKVVAHAWGSFVMLELQGGATQHVLPWVPPDFQYEALAASALQHDERAVLRRFDRAWSAASAEHTFVEHFWGGVPVRRDGGARLSVTIAPHLGNRVGQVHGGILFGLAALCACSALPASMRLANLSCWFIAPGQGRRLTVRAEVLQAGRNVAVVRTQIRGEGGVRVLEATSQHVRMQ